MLTFDKILFIEFVANVLKVLRGQNKNKEVEFQNQIDQPKLASLHFS